MDDSDKGRSEEDLGKEPEGKSRPPSQRCTDAFQYLTGAPRFGCRLRAVYACAYSLGKNTRNSTSPPKAKCTGNAQGPEGVRWREQSFHVQERQGDRSSVSPK